MEVKSEIHVRELFFKYAEELGFKIIESRTRFPDYVLEGKSGQTYKAEVEYHLADFVRHMHNPREVDFIIFWKDNLRKIPPRYTKKYGKEIVLGNLINLKEELKNINVEVEKDE